MTTEANRIFTTAAVVVYTNSLASSPVDKSVKSGSKTSVMKYNARSRKWQAVGTANFSAAGSKLEICIPKKVLGLAVEYVVSAFCVLFLPSLLLVMQN